LPFFAQNMSIDPISTESVIAILDRPDNSPSTQVDRPERNSVNSVLFAGVVVAIALLAWLAWPILSGRIYVADDLGEFHLPMRAFYTNQLDRSEPFDWCPDLYCGFYLTGEGQVGGYHPLHLLLYRTLPLSLAFGLECWLSYPLMLVGMYLFLRRWQLPREAALFGATAFTFGGFNLLHFVHPNAIAMVAHVPWMLWAIDVCLRSVNARQRRYGFVCIALLTGSQLLLGYPQYAFYSALISGAYACWLARTIGPGRIKSLAAVVGAALIGCLIGGVQLLPTFEALGQSVRQERMAGFAAQGSFQPLNVVQLIEPYLFASRVVGQNTHELTIYAGVVPLVLAFGAFLIVPNNRMTRRLQLASLTVAALALLWSFGEFGPFAWLQQDLPYVNRFRFPCRAICVFQFAIAVLAAVGFIQLGQVGSNRLDSRKLAWLWALPLFSVLIAAVGYFVWQPPLASPALVVAGPILVALAVLLVLLSARGVRGALVSLILLGGVDLGIYGLSTHELQTTSTLSEFVDRTSAPPAAPTTRVALENGEPTQTAEVATRVGDRILLKGWPRVDGYAGLEPRRRLDYSQPKVLQIAGTGWHLSEANDNWVQLTNPCPGAWLVSKAIFSTSPSKDVLELDPSSAALVDEPINLPVSQPGRVALKIDSPGRLDLQTDAPADQLLIINESFHPGWNAKIDSNTSQTVRVNGDFLGIVVPAGTHEIALNFQPESLRYGRLASCFGLGLIVATFLWPLRAARRLPP
jgi:hypothetical protein